MKLLKISLKIVLMATALMPLVVINFLPFPYNFSKFLFFNVIVELAAVLFLIYGLFKGWDLGEMFGKPKAFIPRLVKNPLFLAAGVFLASVAVSTIVAYNSFKAFWSIVERGDGLYGLIHFLVFFVLIILVFDRGDWLKFLKILVAVGGVMIFYGWLQFLGVSSFPFAMRVDARPGSFFENPAYFASYLLFIIAFSLFVALSTKKKSFWNLLGIITAIVAVPTIFLANVRGSILGLFLAVVFFLISLAVTKRSSRIGKLGVKILAAVFVLVVVFFFTRGAGFWQSIPGFDRLATIGKGDKSFETRKIALGSSWSAFLERPILGWGPENYLVAYNKHYNPDYAIYEEAWFDRAHNKIAELMVTQGFIGVLSYLAIFGVAFYLLFKKRIILGSGGDGHIKNDGEFRASIGKASMVAGALLIGHFSQNLFLFDTPVGYMMFFSFLGFLVSCNLVQDEAKNNKQAQVLSKVRGEEAKLVFSGLFVFIFVAGIIYNFYEYNYLPYRQSRDYKVAIQSERADQILKAADNFLTPYNYAQATIRNQFLQVVSVGDLLRRPNFDNFTNKGIEAMEDLVKKEPSYDPRYYIFLAEAYNEKGKVNPAFLKNSEDNLRMALPLAPKRQDIYYLLAYALVGQGKYDEAIKLAREAILLSPAVAKAHYSLGLDLALAGQKNWDEAESEFAKALDIGFLNTGLGGSDFNNMSIIYQNMLNVYIPKKDKERVVRIAQRMKQVDSKLVEDLDKLIKLVESNQWEVLFQSIKFSSPPIK